MLRRFPRQVSWTAVVVALVLAPVAARAQSTPLVAESRLPSPGPSLMVSMAASPLALDDWRRSDGPALVGSVQGRLNRFLALEGEATRWTAVDNFGFMRGLSEGGPFFVSDHRDRDVWTVGTNLLFRGGTSRVTGFAGGGVGVRFVREDSSSTFVCPPGPGKPPICTGEAISQSSRRTDTSLSPQFLVGGEFWLRRRLAAYGGARFAFGADQARSTAGFAPLAGLRVALRTTDVPVQEAPPRPSDPIRAQGPDPIRAQGKEVRVTLTDEKTERGTLEAFSPFEVTLEGKVIPLADVRKIEKVGRATRKAVAIGFLAGLPTFLILGPAADMGSDMALMIVAAGVGSGIAVGAVIDAARKPGNVIYLAPGTSASFAVRPILEPGRRGVAFATRW